MMLDYCRGVWSICSSFTELGKTIRIICDELVNGRRLFVINIFIFAKIHWCQLNDIFFLDVFR